MEQLIDFIKKLGDTGDFMPRWICGQWTEFHGWMYILSNVAIWGAYFMIPVFLIFLTRKRRDIPFYPVLIWFMLFILLCGITHGMDALMFWIPLYRVNAIVLFLTSLVSWVTVYVLYKTIPKALAYNSPEQLRQIIKSQTKELELTNQKLRESENNFKALVNKNPDAIVKVGKDFRYTFVNESLEKISSVGLDEFIGKTPTEIFPNHPHTQIFMDSLRLVFETHRAVQYEVSDLSPKYGLKTFAVEMIPLLDDHGEAADVLTITKDVTTVRENEARLNKIIYDLNHLTKRLEYKRKTLQDFAYIVSHNLRSPVSNLISLANLYEKSEDPEFKSNLVQKFISVSGHLAETVEDLTKVVNINQSNDLERETLVFRELLEKQMKAVSTTIESIQAEVVYDFTRCESIIYPRVYLESIFLNLLTNALKYSSRERKPYIRFETFIDEKGIITLICEDNGLGIDMEKYGSKLFSLHKTFHNHPDSRGVGLFITKNQINSLGGTIHAESEPNKGTKFIIVFNQFNFL